MITFMMINLWVWDLGSSVLHSGAAAIQMHGSGEQYSPNMNALGRVALTGMHWLGEGA